MRPPSPRRTRRNPSTVPIEPVYGESRLVSSAAVNDFCQSIHGFAAVSSPGSHSAFRYGTAKAGFPPCHTSSTASEWPPSEAAKNAWITFPPWVMTCPRVPFTAATQRLPSGPRFLAVAHVHLVVRAVGDVAVALGASDEALHRVGRERSAGDGLRPKSRARPRARHLAEPVEVLLEGDRQHEPFLPGPTPAVEVELQVPTVVGVADRRDGVGLGHERLRAALEGGDQVERRRRPTCRPPTSDPVIVAHREPARRRSHRPGAPRRDAPDAPAAGSADPQANGAILSPSRGSSRDPT